LRDVITARDERVRTAHDVSATTDRQHLSKPVHALTDHRAKATERQRKHYLESQQTTHTAIPGSQLSRGSQASPLARPNHSIDR
jgi:hypothetical protein